MDILDPEQSANPFADWDVAYLPYCDGSLFVGDRDHDEDGDGRVDRQHRGLANLTAGLEATRAAFPSLAHRLCRQLGGFEPLLALPIVRAVYPDVELAVLSDSAVGVAREPPTPTASCSSSSGAQRPWSRQTARTASTTAT